MRRIISVKLELNKHSFGLGDDEIQHMTEWVCTERGLKCVLEGYQVLVTPIDGNTAHVRLINFFNVGAEYIYEKTKQYGIVGMKIVAESCKKPQKMDLVSSTRLKIAETLEVTKTHVETTTFTVKNTWLTDNLSYAEEKFFDDFNETIQGGEDDSTDLEIDYSDQESDSESEDEGSSVKKHTAAQDIINHIKFSRNLFIAFHLSLLIFMLSLGWICANNMGVISSVQHIIQEIVNNIAAIYTFLNNNGCCNNSNEYWHDSNFDPEELNC